MNIRSATDADMRAVTDIYNHYIANTIISFEETLLSVEEMQARYKTISASYPWLVGEVENNVIGYAYAALWQERIAYRHCAITSLYLDKDETGKGYGKPLYMALLKELAKTDCHVIIAGIALPNPASTGLHDKLGFEKVAHFKEVGRKMNQWIDVGYWQKTLRD